MYAPRQHRQEKKKPYSNFLALEQVEHEGPIMAPPVYSATGQIVESEEKQEAKEEKKKSTPAVKEATEQNAVQNNRQQESEGGESENESETATESKSVKKSAVGRSEAPPQFKLQAGAPFQFKFASAPIQMKAGNGAGSGGGSNSGIPDHVKSQMEGSFGTSFDDVKVTANSNAAKDAGALAFAQGNNIHFAPGQFNPESKGGQELLGHELAHVVQQRQGRVQANAEVGGMPVNNDHGLEAEADNLGAKAAQFKVDSSASVQKMSAGGSGAGAVQMKLDPNAEPKSEQQAEAKEQEAETTEHENQESAHEHGNLDDHLALDGFDKRPEETEETKEDENEDGNQDALAKGDKPENGEVESPENENEEASETRAGNETEAGETTENEGEEQAKDELEDKAKDAGETEEPKSEEAEEAKEEAEGKEGENQESKSEAPAEGEANAGAKGAEAASGGGGGAGAGGDAGAGGGGESGGGAAEAGGGAAPIVVMPAERGNFGEGEEPDLMVVNEEAVGEFDSKRIIKNNGDGTYIVVSGTPSVSDASSSDLPVQMADDSTKKKPIKKKLSKSQGKEMFAANREKTKSYLAEFEAAAKSKIATLEGAKGSISGQVNSGASAAKAAILSAAAAEKSRVEGAFEAHKSALLADAERIKAETRAQMQTSVGLVQTAAETARTNVEAEFTTQDAAFVALEPVQKAKFTAAFDKGREDMIKAAEELGKIAIEKGEAKAQEYEAMPIPEQSWDEDLLNGSEYEKDRHNARVKAAREVGKSYADQFMQKAKEEGDKLKGSGEAELHKYVTDSVTASRDGIAQRKQAAFDEITAHETGAIQTLQTNCEATVAGIDAAAQGGVAALDQQKAQALGQIDTTAQGKMQAVDAVAQEKIANLESQVQSSIDALTNQMNMTISGVSSRKNPNAEAVHGQLQGALQGIEGGVQSSMTTIDGGIMASIEGLNGTATETATEMNTAATAFIDGGASMKTTLVTNLEGQRDGFKTAATTIADGASTSMTLSAESAAKDMQDQYKAVTADFDKAQAGLDAKMTENSAAFKANIQEQLNGIDAKIKEEADKAYDAVQPRWVSWLLTAIDILVMIIITAVVLIAVASGVGILGLLLIGAVAGAIGGAIKYGARVGLTSEEASWAGLGTEMLNGAVDGLNIAVGMIPGLGPVASALSQIGMGALGGAIKYGGDCLINGKEFSWSALGGKVFLGGLEGAMGMIGGKAGDGVSNFLTKKIGTEAMEKLGNRIIVDVAKTGTEAMFDTVNGGLQNMFESYFETGTLDFGKFTEKLTVGEFLTNAATSKVTDFGAGKISDGAISHFNITPKTDGGSSNDPTNGSQSETVGGDNTTTNKSENVGGDNTPVNTDQTNNVGGDTTPPVNDAPVNSDQTNNIGDGNNSTPETQNNTLSGDGKNKDSNTDPANQGGDTPVLVPPVNQSPTTADTNPTPDPSKTNGQKQAEAKGYPPAPNGFEWVAKSDGTPYLRRQSGNADSLPQVRYDAATGQFTPVKSAPDGYHWKYENGAFSIHPNGNAGDLPPMQYDPTTQGFMTADGKPYNGDITTLAVRGQDFDGFVKSVRDPNFDADTAKQAYELYAKKDWAALEKLFTDKGLNGGWPPNRGFIDMKPGTLKAGDTFDRFGGRIDPVTGKFTDTGRFVAPFGADFGGRALPQTHLDGDPVTGDKPAFKGYKILKDIPMMEGDAIPWFGQPGGGKQYELPPGGIDKLIADGYIVEITAPNLHGKTDGDGVTNDADNTDGGGGLTPTTDGGGMKGKTNAGEDVYVPRDGKPRLKDLKPKSKDSPDAEKSQLRDTFINAANGVTVSQGATVTQKPGTVSTMVMTVNGVTAEIQVRNVRSSDHAAATTSHGTQHGPAYCKVTYTIDPVTGLGKWEAIIHLNENAEVADLNKMAIHELSEIADIIASESAAINRGDYNDQSGGLNTTKVEAAINQQQQASVFTENALNVSPANLTAHDRAAARELGVVVNEVEAAINDRPATSVESDRSDFKSAKAELDALKKEKKDDPSKGTDPDYLTRVAAAEVKKANAEANLAKHAEYERQITRLKTLMKTMGVEYTGSAGFKLLVNNLGLTLPPSVSTYFDRHVGSDAGNQMIKDIYHAHVNIAKVSGATVEGGHNQVAFLAAINGRIHAVPTPSTTPGVTVYQYYPIVNGNPDLTATPKTKTTYDPAVWTEARIVQSASEAFANHTLGVDPQIGPYWVGVDANGVTIKGLYLAGSSPIQITTFWPE